MDHPSTPARGSGIPNLITGARLALLPVLWTIAAFDEPKALAVGIAAVASTDLVDGVLARRLHARSELGSRLDSIADHLLSASVLVWIAWLRPDFVARHGNVLAGWASFGAITLLVGWIRFRRVGDLHLYSAKLAMALGYVFALALLYFGTYHPVHFAVTLGALFVATAESLLVYLTRRDPNERIGSILSRGGR